MLSLVLIETQNVPIPTMKIFKYNIMPVELYLPESFKSQALFNSRDFKFTNIKDFTKFTIISCYKNSALKREKPKMVGFY